MRKPKSRTATTITKTPAPSQAGLIRFMLDTAEHHPELEGMLLRIADIGNIPEVRAQIERLRKYAKRRNGRKVA